MIVFFLYFSQWLVIENKVADIWFNLIFVGSTILLLLTSPIFASISDKRQVKMPYLRITTSLMFIGLLMTSLLTNFFNHTSLTIILAALLFLLANYFYQFSFTFYNSLLNNLTNFRNRGLISGIGQFCNWTGQIAGLAIGLPLATGLIYLTGNHGRSQAFLPATLIFFVISLPMLLFFKEKVLAKPIQINLVQEYKHALKSFITLCKEPGVGRFLLGYFLYNDAVLTVINNMPIVLEQVFHLNDKIKSIILGSILIGTALGALIAGILADKFGTKKMLIFALIGWLIALPFLGLATNLFEVVIAMTILAFVYGANASVARAAMINLAPKDKLTHSFSYYTLAERTSSFLGPIIWGLIILFLMPLGDARYRVALLSMTLFIMLGLLIIGKIPSKLVNS